VEFLKRSVVERELVGPRAGFGVLECQYGTENIGGHDYKKLESICLTPVGRGLLELLSS
jgi:hypothetical protein